MPDSLRTQNSILYSEQGHLVAKNSTTNFEGNAKQWCILNVRLRECYTITVV